MLTLDDFPDRTPAEEQLIGWLKARDRRVCPISEGLPEANLSKVRLRASLVRELALGTVQGVPLPETGLRVRGAWIAGDGPEGAEGAETRGLDLEGCSLPGDLTLFACRCPDMILLRGAKVRSVFLNDAWLEAGLGADGLQAEGDVFLRGMTATGAVRLTGARLDGGLDCTGATLTAQGGDALMADGLQAEGDVFLRGVTATGEVRLAGARLGGDLSCEGATFTVQGGHALIADRLQAGGGVFLDGVTAMGEVRLAGTRLGGDLSCEGATFTVQGGPALMADRLQAEGGVFLRGVTAMGAVRLAGTRLGGDLSCEGATFTAKGGHALMADGLQAEGGVYLNAVEATGAVRLVGARLGGGLECDGATFTAQGDHALNLQAARITGALLLRDGARVEGRMVLTGAEIGAICDDPACWPGAGELLLDRCRYGAFVGRAPVDAARRIHWLGLQDAGRYGHEFWPQPYEECARVLREGGHSGAARAVLIEKERLGRAAKRARVARDLAEAREAWAKAVPVSGYRPHTDRVVGHRLRLALLSLWDGIVGVVIGYGRRPQDAFVWLAALWLLGAVIFGVAGGHGAIKPNDPKIQIEPIWKDCHDDPAFPTQYHCFMARAKVTGYPAFNALVYSADTLIPVISFEMQSYWLPDDRTTRGAAVRLYLWLHIVAGWGLTLLAVAGFSGLVKQDSK